MNTNFDFGVLLGIKKVLSKAKLKIMINDHCLADCPYRIFHYNNHYAHSKYDYDYHKLCKKRFLKYPYLMLTNNTIRPEDLYMYHEVTDEFKIVSRIDKVEDVII